MIILDTLDNSIIVWYCYPFICNTVVEDMSMTLLVILYLSNAIFSWTTTHSVLLILISTKWSLFQLCKKHILKVQSVFISEALRNPFKTIIMFYCKFYEEGFFYIEAYKYSTLFYRKQNECTSYNKCGIEIKQIERGYLSSQNWFGNHSETIRRGSRWNSRLSPHEKGGNYSYRLVWSRCLSK